MTKQKRRSYTSEFKQEAVKFISEQGYSYAEAGRNLGVNPNQLSRWKRHPRQHDSQKNASGIPGAIHSASVFKQLTKLLRVV